MSYRREDTRALRASLTMTPYDQKPAEACAQLEPEMSGKPLMVRWDKMGRAHGLRTDAVSCRTATPGLPWPTIARRGTRSLQRCSRSSGASGRTHTCSEAAAVHLDDTNAINSDTHGCAACPGDEYPAQ